jgi:hypothetical protein
VGSCGILEASKADGPDAGKLNVLAIIVDVEQDRDLAQLLLRVVQKAVAFCGVKAQTSAQPTQQ